MFFSFYSADYFGFSQQKYYDEVYFSSDSDSLTTASIKRLDSLIKKLKPGDKTIISISGHCDSIGNETYNDNLSLKRAHSVGAYIINKSIKNDSILIFGYGKTKPKYFATEWEKNCRVEITLTIFPPVMKVVRVKKDTVKTNIEGFVDTAKVGDKIALQNITFHGGSNIPLQESYKTLEELYTSLKDNPTINISIEGHICCLNVDIEDLSGQRAKAVYDYLVNKGIDKNRLTYKGLGHTQPITKERNEVERQMNRRVEIRVTKK